MHISAAIQPKKTWNNISIGRGRGRASWASWLRPCVHAIRNKCMWNSTTLPIT